MGDCEEERCRRCDELVETHIRKSAQCVAVALAVSIVQSGPLRASGTVCSSAEVVVRC